MHLVPHPPAPGPGAQKKAPAKIGETTKGGCTCGGSYEGNLVRVTSARGRPLVQQGRHQRQASPQALLTRGCGGAASLRLGWRGSEQVWLSAYARRAGRGHCEGDLQLGVHHFRGVSFFIKANWYAAFHLAYMERNSSAHAQCIFAIQLVGRIKGCRGHGLGLEVAQRALVRVRHAVSC